ncbi:MAG: hypothetical protein VR67_12075 [Peptococcaceae bacterium BRH_c8a]|nr:MAG: hypothetical protein VR67_12075 [Peptococcaceae bacterium BRH_c8a]
MRPLWFALDTGLEDGIPALGVYHEVSFRATVARFIYENPFVKYKNQIDESMDLVKILVMSGKRL